MKTLMIEATDRNWKIVNRMNVETKDFCGWINVIGNEKTINKLAKKVKVLIF